jgi:tRNA(fMet)-specific endonuclease VapC
LAIDYLLDTSTISLAQGTMPVDAIVRRMEQRGERCVIAAGVLHELLYGVQNLPLGKRRNDLARYVEAVRSVYAVLPYDSFAAAWHAEEHARLRKIGRTPPFLDSQIAAVAAVNGLTLVTANVRDFEDFHGLRIEDWSRAV